MAKHRKGIRVLLAAGLAAALGFALRAPATLGAAAPAGEERGFRGFLAIRGDRVLAAENAERLFTPASVLKLVVAATALHHLGPDYRVTTRVRAGGPLSDGAVAGDLVVEAAGDPTWSRRFFEADPRAPLRALARQLRERGVSRVSGDLVVDASRFPGRPYPPSRPLAELAYGYGAPASALAVDGNAIAIDVAPGRNVGDLGTARLAGSFDWLRLRGRIRTVPRERHGRGTVDFQPVWDGATILVRGEYPLSEPPYRIDLAVPDGDRHAGEVMADLLRDSGIEIVGRVRVSSRPAPVPGAVLARFESPPLAEMLRPVLTDSDNWIAEMLLRQVALAVAGEGRDDVGLDLERRLLEEEVQLPPGSFELDDASGLSPYNLITPEAVVELLRWAWRQEWRPAFLAALPGRAEGTLGAWRSLPPLAAKTGTVRHALALAGYADFEGREPLVFACFFNHRPGDRGRMRDEIAGLVNRWRRLSN